MMAGIGLTVLAFFLFSFHDAAIKWLVAGLPVWQILFFRSAVILTGCLIVGRGALIARAIMTPLRWKLVLRGLILLAAWICYYGASRDLPLGELMTLYFVSPVIVTILAIPMLGERVTPWRWTAVVTGFAGVVVAFNPTDIGLSVPAALALFSACLWAVATILIRMIAMHESALLQMLFGNTVNLIGTGIALFLVWQTPSPGELALMLAIGGIGGLGQFTMFTGMRMAPASVLAPLTYTGLIWAFALGYIVWGDVPRIEVVIGAVLILAAGLIMIAAGRQEAPAER
ncbi:MAG: DMT family transporter [Alphaproteobacteria bacterium]|nr:DMT family transporter [Alphaproteobacteria bacterium]